MYKMSAVKSHYKLRQNSDQVNEPDNRKMSGKCLPTDSKSTVVLFYHLLRYNFAMHCGHLLVVAEGESGKLCR